MKFEDIARPAAVVLGVAGIAAGALLGFAAGVAVMRDPDAARRAAARAARLASQGFEQATLLAAQAREHLGDMWAEAEAATAQARATADETDFARQAAATAATAGTAAAAATSATAATTAAGAADSPSEKGREQSSKQGSASGERAAGAASPRKRAPRKKAAAKRGETPAGPEASSAE